MQVLQGPNLVLIGTDLTALKHLISALDALRGEFQNLRITACDPNDMVEQLAGGAQGVVVDVQEWTSADEMIILALRGKGYIGPVLVLAKFEKAQDGTPMVVPRAFDKVFYLGKPVDQHAMYGVVKRMILEPIIAARRFPRHVTNERAELQLEGQKTSQPCSVKNMSKGGAYIEFERSVYVRVGDTVTLSIRLGQLNRQYALRGRVAWLNTRNSGFGIEFMSAA